ncbi:pentraxin fusion protein-like [Epinephelus lanceolatus]
MNGSQYIWILIGHLLQNVALNKKAIQSSVGFGDAARAVDGNKDPRLTSKTCIHTKEESDPWWRVDLQNVYKIAAVTITNRKEHSHRLNGAEIWIKNSIETNDTKSIRCAVISHIPSEQTVYFPCSAAEGCYVMVLVRGSNKVLSLCEVEVFRENYAHPLSNVALKGNATQSSTLSFATASKAIDGRRHSYYSQGSCSHTAEKKTNPWWRVDLRRTYIVNSVKITNRGDCCAKRLDGAEIRIGNSLENNGNSNPRY